MAKIEFDVESLSFAELADMPNDVQYEILDAGAKVAKKAHQKTLLAMGLVESRQLHDSLRIVKKLSKDGEPYIDVYPTGRRKASLNNGRVTYYRKKTRRGTRGSAKPATNNDVGFIYEFGAPNRGIAAKEWMRTANEQSADAVLAAEEAVYDDYLKNKGLID